MKSINMINIMSLFISVNAQLANAFTPLILYYRMTGGLSYNNPSYENINTDSDNNKKNNNYDYDYNYNNKRLQSVIICKSMDDDYECYEDNDYECYTDDYLESYSNGNEKPCSDEYYEGYKDLIKYDNRYKDFWDEYYTGNINKDGVNYDNKHIIENALDEKNKKEQNWNNIQKKIKNKHKHSSATEHPKTNVDDYPLLP